MDLTRSVEEHVKRSGVVNGQVTAFAVGSTTGITTIENEPGLRQDLKDFLNDIIPYGKSYKHHERWGCDNGSSHLQSALIKTSLTIPVISSKMTLGTWQQIVFLELDTKHRSRTVICQIIGE